MRHIPVNQCGRTGYQCKETPVARLDTEFFCGTDLLKTVNTSITGGTAAAELDNYGNIPEKLMGFVMTIDNIPDFTFINPYPASGTTSIEVTERSCRTDMSPFDYGHGNLVKNTNEVPGASSNRTDGYLNLFGKYPSLIYVDVSGTTTHLNTSNPAMVNADGDPLTANPGILEPMLEVAFDNINIDVPPALESTLDGFEYTLATIQAWRTQIDARVRDIWTNNITVYGDDQNLRELEKAQESNGPCDRLNIVVASGAEYIITSRTDNNVPTYKVTAGNFKYMGTTYPVAETSIGSPAPPTGSNIGITAYLIIGTVSGSVTAGVYTTQTPSGVSDILYTGKIGSVVRVIGEDNVLKIWKIQQPDCIEDVEDAGDTSHKYDQQFAVSVAMGDPTAAEDPTKRYGIVKIGSVYIDGSPVYTMAGDAHADIDALFNTPNAVITVTATVYFDIKGKEVSGYSVGGIDPSSVAFNLTFSNGSSSVTVPSGSVVRGNSVSRVIGIIHTDAAKTYIDQIQYGNMYLSSNEHKYDGPFAIAYGSTTSTGTTPVTTTKVDVNGGYVAIGSTSLGSVSHTQIAPPSTTPAYVYLTVTYTKTGDVYSDFSANITAGTTAVSPTAPVAAGSTVSVELGMLHNGVVDQFQFGNVILPIADGGGGAITGYDGPFAVSGIAYTLTQDSETGTWYVNVNGVPYEVYEDSTTTPSTWYADVNGTTIYIDDSQTINTAYCNVTMKEGYAHIGNEFKYVPEMSRNITLHPTDPVPLYLNATWASTNYSFIISPTANTAIQAWSGLIATISTTGGIYQEQYGDIEIAGRWFPTAAPVTP